MRNRPLIIALIVMGVMALGLTAMSMLNSGGNTNTAPDPTLVVATPTPAPVTTLVVANRDIPPRTLITRGMLRTIEAENVDPSSFSRIEDVIGTLSNADTIRQGKPLLITSVVKPLERRVPANFEVPAGLRAVAIFVDPNQTAAGLVDIGDRIDVLATYKLTQQTRDTDRYSQVVVGTPNFVAGRTIAQDLLVLAVDRSIAQPPAAPQPSPPPGATPIPPAPGAAPATPTPTPVVQPKSRVILAARPDVAARLVAAQDSGTLYVTIRNPNSREQAPVAESREYPSRVVNVPKPAPRAPESASRAENNTQPIPYIPPVPSQPVPPMPTGGADTSGPILPSGPSGSDVTVIRGTEKSRVTVPTS